MITTVVVPTMGRPSLHVLLEALVRQTRTVDVPVILVDDRPEPDAIPVDVATYPLDITVVRTGGGGPARARNIGWRHARTPWVSFLDDDVLPDDDWYALLLDDLAEADDEVAGVEGRLTVPLPTDRRSTDWERGTAGLETSRWITADMSYRRDELSAVGGFDERFPRAFREDADLALRLGAERGRVVTGRRHVTHPVRPADDLASLRQQRGNADDYLMRAIHGPGWQQRADAPVGRRWRHVAITGSLALATVGLLARRRGLAVLGASAWLAGTAEFALRRILPGPRDRAEVRRMLVTSAAIPAAATWHSVRGAMRHRGAAPWRGLPELVLLDRDGTLVEDVPYNGDPAQVRPLPGVREALDRLRREGIRLVVVSNQSGVGRGLIDRTQVEAVNERVEALLGPFEGFYYCPHAAEDGCDCRKPQPGLLKQALADTGVRPDRAVMIGDIGSDLGAAEAAGMAGILVPTDVTLPGEVAAAPLSAGSLGQAVDLVQRGEW
ncbi:histidinol-phosphate phosphatase family domain-containing protein/HAD-superfamily hydrolase, subfamily IIIA [Nocardioides terrae]|uniref:D,D-heptose 1,7-bisphosphate phosphatase n=1 Tax=Nocardioides terrae TaxID=574651 RepID=A0A1I1IBR8_9ACTN|nr:HAD-IIIA family hydrolase [Nocardioides terrae]SFC33697.1 histidinol-phosphate phosphatase family domain-containing protein/HAD-superfamily hydrolase, subfamily IIIA [Nocardioides terrae]